jgi:hypothetical protein
MCSTRYLKPSKANYIFIRTKILIFEPLDRWKQLADRHRQFWCQFPIHSIPRMNKTK